MKTTTKAKKFQVFVGADLKIESNHRTEAVSHVGALQSENVPEIKLVNHEAQVTHLYIKGRYDKNYRITKGAYAPAVVEKPQAEAEETE
jgi:hypothetical protein